MMLFVSNNVALQNHISHFQVDTSNTKERVKFDYLFKEKCKNISQIHGYYEEHKSSKHNANVFTYIQFL